MVAARPCMRTFSHVPINACTVCDIRCGWWARCVRLLDCMDAAAITLAVATDCGSSAGGQEPGRMPVDACRAPTASMAGDAATRVAAAATFHRTMRALYTRGDAHVDGDAQSCAATLDQLRPRMLETSRSAARAALATAAAAINERLLADVDGDASARAALFDKFEALAAATAGTHARSDSPQA